MPQINLEGMHNFVYCKISKDHFSFIDSIFNFNITSKLQNIILNIRYNYNQIIKKNYLLQLPISLQNLSKNYNIDFTRIYKELLEFTKKYVGKKS